MIEAPEVTRTTEQTAAVIHITIPRKKMPEVMGPAIGELMEAIAAQGIAPAGPLFAHHLKMEPETFDFELGVPVTQPVASAGRVKAGRLPAAKVARTVYHGPYEGLPGAWGEFDKWIESEGYAQAPNLWERYVEGPDSSPDPATWRTELNRPLVD